MKAGHTWPEFAQRLRTVRGSAELTMKECADLLAVKYGTYCHWELGTYRPRDFDIYEKIARFFNVSPAWLTFGGETPQPDEAIPARNAALHLSESPTHRSKTITRKNRKHERPIPQIAIRGRKYVAYYRVSSPGQAPPRTSLIAQRALTRQFIKGKGVLIGEFREIESARGSKRYRPILAQAISICRQENATLVVATVDRLTRNVAFLSQLIESGVEIAVIDLPEANKLTLHVAAAVAEHEGEVFSESARAVHAIRKSRGVVYPFQRMRREDRLRGWYNSGEANRAKVREFDKRIVPLLRAFRTSGITSRIKMADLLNESCVPTARGGKWHPVTITNIESRMTPPVHSVVASAILARRTARKFIPHIEAVFNSGNTSYRQICDELNRRRIRSPTGAMWHTSGLLRVLQHNDLTLERLQRRLARSKGASEIWHGYRSINANQRRRLRPQIGARRRSAKLRHKIVLPPQFRAPIEASKFVAYIRVSSGGQALSGIGEEVQRREIRRFCRGKGSLIAEFTEYESAYGIHCRRPKLLSAIQLCKQEHAALIVARMNRLSRNVAFVAALMEGDIEFHTLDNPSANRLTAHILAAFAEYDSRQKSARLRLAKAVAKAQGRPSGGFGLWPKARLLKVVKKISRQNREFSLQFAKALHPIIDRLREQGFRTYREIAAGLALEGVPTRLKKKWDVTSVRVVDILGRDTVQTTFPGLFVRQVIGARYYAAEIRKIKGAAGLSYTEIANRLNGRNVKRPEHGRWSSISVSRTLARSKIKAIEYVNGRLRCTYVLPPIHRL